MNPPLTPPIIRSAVQHSGQGAPTRNWKPFIIVGICVHLVTFLFLVIAVWRGGWSDGSRIEAILRQQVIANNRSATAEDVSRIESVLRQDAAINAKTAAEVVSKMRGIDTSGCPNDFKAAYLARIHAWESLTDFDKHVAELKTEIKSISFIAKLVGKIAADPLGSLQWPSDLENQVKRRLETIDQDIKLTFRRVELIAVAYGATLPKK